MSVPLLTVETYIGAFFETLSKVTFFQAICPFEDSTTTVYCPAAAGPATCTASGGRPSDIGGK